MHGRDDKYIQNSGQKLEGKRPFGRPMRRWEDDIRMDLTEIGGKVGDWIHLAQVWTSGRFL